jgi:hypothetical protein
VLPRTRLARVLPGLVAILLCLPLLAACTDAGGTDDSGDDTASLLPMTLAEFLFPPDTPAATGEPIGVAHLSIAPMKPGDNDLTVVLTDLDGKPLNGPALALAWRPLSPDAGSTDAKVTPVEGEAATWRVDDLALADQDWYAFDLTLAEGDSTVATSTLYALLPDPSVYGAEALDTPKSDPDAEALYQRALTTYGGWQTGRWRENLGSGQDVLVVTQYAVDSGDPQRAAMATESIYAGAFRPKADGSAPSPVQRDFAHRIAIGEQWWSREDSGAWSESSGLPVSGFPERADVYSGATGIQPAGTETVDGVKTQVITFYLPPKGGQAEAWFAWWVDPETGNLVRMAMIAQVHFMIWDFYDVNAPLTIEPPGELPATPAASPIATPAG